MSFARLVLRSLMHYRRTGVVVAVGLAVATAVIVGSLIIGDSVEGSIRHTALARLGVILDAVTAPRFFHADLADSAELWGMSASLIRLDGSARAEMGDAVIADVAVIGADEDFFDLYPESDLTALEAREAIINEALASDADVGPGETLLVTVSRPARAMTGTLFARRERDQTLATLRVNVREVLPDLGPGGFRLDPSTTMPRNVIVDRGWLGEQIGEEDRANTLVLGPVPRSDGTYPPPVELRRTDVFGPAHPTQQRQQIRGAMTLEDHGLYLRHHHPWLSVFSKAVTLTEGQVGAAQAAASGIGEVSPISVYLADRIAVSSDPSRSIAYAVIADLSAEYLPPASSEALPARLSDDEIVLNAWAAEDLGAVSGERLSVTWRVSTPWGYEERSEELTLAGVAPMEGAGADPNLVPDFEGITDAEHVADWDPPFPIDLSRVTERDDEYWERYRAAPKGFAGSDLLRRAWRGDDDAGPWITSVRVGPLSDDRDVLAAYEQALLRELTPEDAGMRFVPVREQALEASRGTSDFGQLFLAMSVFLVAAGAGLAGTLMRLSAQQRASQAGIMLATGFNRAQARRVIFAEGTALAVIGVAAGVPLGVLYAHGIMGALATRWQGALGDAPVLGVFVHPQTVAAGAAAALVVGLIATWWGARTLSDTPVLGLLRGWRMTATAQANGLPWTSWATPVLVLTAAGLFIAAMTGSIAAEGAFFGIGGALLLAALTGAHLLLTRTMRLRGASDSVNRLALRSAACARGRSLLLIGLIAAATFVIVTVAANSRDFTRIDVRERSSGTGGFTHVATTSVPLRFDPATREGRENLGFLPDEEQALKDATIISLPRSPGEDISCLNIARPTHPRLLGVTDELIARGGFTVSVSREAPGGEPWRLLEERVEAEPIPAFGDSASLTWQLDSGLGQTYDLGEEMPSLEFVGALQGSIFQSELLVHERALRRLYPEIAGPTYLLIEAPDCCDEQVAEALRAALGEMGLQVRSTAEVLNEYITVQNTYLTMFLALGGLGLLLGTIGLVAVILRSAFERRSEFALMLATGFTPANLAWLLLVENAGLLIVGMVTGAVTALIAVSPHLATAQAAVNWGALVLVLGAILLVGLVACAAGARMALRGELIEALRTE